MVKDKMTNNQSETFQRILSAREKIISGIGTPLGFFVLALLIIEGFLWGAGSAFDLPVEVRIRALWVGVGLFVLVLFVVVILVVFFPKNLVFSEKSHLQAMAIYGAKDLPISELLIDNTPSVSTPQQNLSIAQISISANEVEGGQNE